MYFYISLGLFFVTCGSALYMYKNRVKLFFNVSKILLKSLTSNYFKPSPTRIKKIDNIIVINDPEGVIMLPYKRKAAFKSVNSNIDLVVGNQRKRVIFYPGFEFNLSPNDLNCSSIEVNRDGYITIFRDDEKFNWDII
jgi:hypothetical protein